MVSFLKYSASVQQIAFCDRLRAAKWKAYQAVMLMCLLMASVFSGCFQEEAITTQLENEDRTSDATTPNILFIVVDTLRADRVSMERAGIPLMPFIRDFSKHSWTFNNATAQATWTRPSMASMFTSLYASVHNQQFGVSMQFVEGQDYTVDVLPDSMETMASFFKNAGYTTLAIQTNWNMQPIFGVSQGFDRYDMLPFGKNAADVTALALEIIQDTQEPFLLYAHYMDPHFPYEPPEQYRNLFGTLPAITETDKEILANYGPGYYTDKIRWDLGLEGVPPLSQFSSEGKEYVRAMYDGEVRFADDEIERLIKTIRNTYPDTIIVFTSDHGEELWERGSIGHGKTVYEEVAHVPLIIAFPSQEPRTVEQRVDLIDILPTLAEYTNLPLRSWWQGKSLINNTDSDISYPVFCQTMTSLREANLFLISAATQEWKVIHNVIGQEWLLYNLQDDPLEKSPLTNPEKLDTMRSLLDTHFEDNRNHPMYAPPTTQHVLDSETEEMLRSQGYL